MAVIVSLENPEMCSAKWKVDFNSHFRVSISYATYGERIHYTPPSQAPNAVSTASVEARQTTRQSQASVRPGQSGKVTSANTARIDVAKEAYLATTLDSEQQIYQALKPALGEAKARKQAIETAIRALEANGHSDWIADYKSRSTLVD